MKFSRFLYVVIIPLVAGILISCQQHTATSELLIEDMECEYLTQPRGLDVLSPRLGWKINASEFRGAKQTAYRIIVASSSDKLLEGKADLWDTGKVTSGQSVQVAYQGKTLRSEMQCYWKVMIWDQDGILPAYPE